MGGFVWRLGPAVAAKDLGQADIFLLEQVGRSSELCVKMAVLGLSLTLAEREHGFGAQ